MNCDNASFNGDGEIFTKQYLVGEIIMWPNKSNFPSNNFLPCDGRELDKGTAGSTYYDLWQIIQNNFGGTSPKFNLPNLNFDSDSIDDTKTDQFCLVKGSSNMANNSSIDNNISATISGNNKIPYTINHNHNGFSGTNATNTTTNINHNIEHNNSAFVAGNTFSNATDLYLNSGKRRAYRTSDNDDIVGAGGGNSTAYNEILEKHQHTIIYSDTTKNHTATGQDINENFDNNDINFGSSINNQKKYIPKSLKIHYIICYKQN